MADSNETIMALLNRLANEVSEHRRETREMTEAIRKECKEDSDKVEERVSGLRTDLTELKGKVEVNNVKLGVISSLSGLAGSFLHPAFRGLIGK